MRIVGCFLEFDGKFLVLLRKAHKPNGNTWGLPAGKVESGEDDMAAMLRELKEETGYRAVSSEIELLGEYGFGQNDNAYVFSVYRLKLGKTKHDVVVENTAHADFKWVTAVECDGLPNLIPGFHELLRILHLI